MTIGQSFFGVLKYAPFIVIAKLFRKNLIVHLHGNHLLKEYDSLQGIKKKIFFWLISMFDHGIVLSESLKQNFLPFIAKKNIHVVYNFVDDNLILPDYELSRKKDFSEIRLFFMSNLLAEKGINLLLGAVQKLNLEGQLVKVKVAGTKIAGNNIDNMLESLPNVEYVGIVHNTKKQDLLIWGNVFCLPTSFNMEGQPISILEAMALNNLIVTTKHAGIPDICTDENAVFCEKNNEEDLYIKLKDVISHWEVLKGKAVMNGVYAREQFSEQKFIANIEDIILNKV